MVYQQFTSQRTLLRQELRNRCHLLSFETRIAAGHAVAKTLLGTNWFQQSQTIACYLNDDLELPTQVIIELIWQQQKACYLPLVLPAEPGLQFAPYHPNAALQVNQYHLLQPVLEGNDLLADLTTLDLVLVPLLGFDMCGNRLGRGAGYYDKTFAFLREIMSEQRRPKLVGLAYACQQTELLEAAPWDVGLDAVVTELGLTKFN